MKWMLFLLPFALALLALLCAFAFRCDLRTIFYQIHDARIGLSARLAVISDLHSTRYGKGQSVLLASLAAQAPDAVLLAGDIVDDVLPQSPAWELLSAIGQRYPCYYVSGNHEVMTGALSEIKQRVRDCGVTVLEGNGETIQFGGQALCLCGVDDPYAFARTEADGDWAAQLRACSELADDRTLSILLTHRPERVQAYRACPFDLVIAGHAHGGQVRIPGLLNGLFAPNQGLFPAYAGGQYALDGSTTMIVSRGLSRRVLPRVWNRPELVIIDLLPPP